MRFKSGNYGQWGLCFLFACAFVAAARPRLYAEEVPDRVIATVNGESIMQSEFFDRLQKMGARDFLASSNPISLRSEPAGTLMLNSLINERLILQWALKTNQLPTEAEINKDVENFKAQPAVTQAIKNGLLTEENLRRDARVSRARFNLAVTAVSITPPEVEAYFKKNIANYSTPERWGLSAVMTTKPDVIPKIQAQIKANKPFGEIAKTFSEETKSKTNNGSIGIAAANDPGLPQPIQEAVKKLKVGEITPPIRVELNAGQGKPSVSSWWFVRLMSKEPAVVRSFSEVKDQVERLALLERAGGIQVSDKKIAEFRKTSVIKILIAGYQALADAPKTP